MSKVLPKGNEFEFTVKFWKTYKPDSVDSKGVLTNCLKDFEKRLELAREWETKADKEMEKKDDKLKDVKVLNDAASAWGLVKSELSNIQKQMVLTLKEMTKDKESHVNLKEAVELALTQLTRGSHIHLMAAIQRHEKFQAAFSKIALGEDKEDENVEFTDWLKKVDKKELRNWANAGREFQNVLRTTGIVIPNESNLKINTIFIQVSAWKRVGVFEKLSSAKNFHKNIDRQIVDLTSQSTNLKPALIELMEFSQKNKPLADFLAAFTKNILAEKKFWDETKKDCPVKPK